MVGARLSYSESAILVRELYYTTYRIKLSPDTDEELMALSTVVDDEPIVGKFIGDILDEYIANDVNKHLGLTFHEYMNTPSMIRKEYVEFLTEYKNELKKSMDDLKDSIVPKE